MRLGFKRNNAYRDFTSESQQSGRSGNERINLDNYRKVTMKHEEKKKEEAPPKKLKTVVQIDSEQRQEIARRITENMRKAKDEKLME